MPQLGQKNPRACKRDGVMLSSGRTQEGSGQFDTVGHKKKKKKPDNLGQLDILRTEISPGKKYRPLDS